MNKSVVKNNIALTLSIVCLIASIMNVETAKASDMNTQMVTSSLMVDNQELGCSAVCKRIGPMTAGDLAPATQLPAIIQNSLHPSIQDFWSSIAAIGPGADATNVQGSMIGIVNGSSGDIMTMTFSSEVDSADPLIRHNFFDTQFAQTVSGGTPQLNDQVTDISFHIESLTDSAGDPIPALEVDIDPGVPVNLHLTPDASGNHATGSFNVSIDDVNGTSVTPIISETGGFIWNSPAPDPDYSTGWSLN